MTTIDANDIQLASLSPRFVPHGYARGWRAYAGGQLVGRIFALVHFDTEIVTYHAYAGAAHPAWVAGEVERKTLTGAMAYIAERWNVVSEAAGAEDGESGAADKEPSAETQWALAQVRALLAGVEA